MKKFFKFALMAFAMLAVSTTMVSCGDDDKDVTPAPEPETAVRGSVTFTPAQESDFSKFYNTVTQVSIEEPNGSFKYTVSNNGSNDATYEFDCPATVKFQTSYPQAQKEVMDDATTYNCYVGPGYKVVAGTASTKIQEVVSVVGTGKEVKAEVAAKAATVYEFSIDKNGVITQK